MKEGWEKVERHYGETAGTYADTVTDKYLKEEANAKVAGPGINQLRPMTARERLYTKVGKLRREATDLEALARAIPENFPDDADRGLSRLMND